MAGLADPPPHGGGFSRFLDTSNYQPCNTDAACTAAGVKYLKAIGVLNAAGQPAGPRKSLDDWKAFVGFNAKVSVATAQALYFNKYDLGFARDANCVFREVGIKPAITTVACYITNYSDAQPGWPGGNPQKSILAAKNHTSPLFTVTMETHFITGLGLPPAGRPQVTFLAYGPTGAPIPAMTFDREGLKPLPGVCVSCHADWFDSGSQTVSGGSFLPFDASAYVFEESRQPILGQPPIRGLAAPQHEAFRMLNWIVLQSQPVQPIKDLIAGWYKHCGGVEQTNCTLDDNFVPSGNCAGSGNGLGETCGWTVANDTLNIKALYQQVIRPYCRNCHLVYYGALNVQSYQAFHARAQQVYDEVIGKLYNMPYAEVPYYLFWNNSPTSALSQQLKTYLNAVGATGP
jgi:hypothetical protein